MTGSFLGSKGENSELLKALLCKIVDAHALTRQQIHPEDNTPPQDSENNARLTHELSKLLERLRDDIPFYHPRYMAQMIRDPSLASILGYFSFLLSNPNNHAYEGGPITTDLEVKIEKQFLSLIGFQNGWGHLTAGGTTANLEALWIAREKHENGNPQNNKMGVFFSEAAHFAWKRLANVVGCPSFAIPVDGSFRMDLNLLEDALKKVSYGFVVANLGSTGTGSVDDLVSLLSLQKKYDFHLHVDAAYGGFYRALLCDEKGNCSEQMGLKSLTAYVCKQLKAVELSDSVTIDPHKHGLVPYGAGAVFYRDEALRKIILHSAPYTYNVTNQPNIGMYCLEGSRPGAAAAACYLTYKMFPLNQTGIGTILTRCLSAAQKLGTLLQETNMFELLVEPDLDILCFYCNTSAELGIEAFNEKNLKIINSFSVENLKSSFFISKFSLSPAIAAKLLGNRPNPKSENAFVMRCVFMKDEAEANDHQYLHEFTHEIARVASE